MSRAQSEPRCHLKVELREGEVLMLLTVPKGEPPVRAGEKLGLWTSPKAARRLIRELEAALQAAEAPR